MFPYNFNNIYGYLRFSNMYMSSPAIEEKLKKSDCTLDELLDEEEIIQEIKNQNSNFDKSKVKALIDYIIREPETDDHKRGHKFPFVASEILSCDVNRINDFFVQTEAELILKDRKDSNISNTDSDLMLSADDHLNAFSNEDKTRNSVKEETQDESKMENVNPNDAEGQVENKEEANASELTSENQKMNFHNKSISDIVSHDNIEELQNIYNNELLEKKKQNRIELLDYLLSFFETETSLNYVLVGYVSRYFNNLLNKNPHKIISYIYLERPEILLKLIHHCSMKSIAEFLPKLFLIEPYLNEKGLERSKDSNNSNILSSPLTLNIEIILNKRKTLLGSLFKALIVEENDIEKISNLATVCIELLESKVVLETIVNDKEIINHLMRNLSKRCEHKFEANFNWTEIANLLLNIVRYTVVENLRAPIYASHHEDTVNHEFPNIENTVLGESILEFIEKVLIHFGPDELEADFEGTFGAPVKPLGSKKLKLIELVYFFMAYFKNVASVINRILIRTNFLKNAIDYFFIYEWNNLYAIAFENLFKSYLNNNLNHPEITKHIFGDLNMLQLFCEKGSTYNEGENEGFTFSSSRKINHGYFAILIELCHKIYETADIHFRDNYFSPAWEDFHKEKVTYWRKLFDRRLCHPDALHNIEIDNHVHDDSKEKSDTDVEPKEADNNEEENKEDNNPFQRDEYFFNMGNGGDDWYNPKKGDENLNHNQGLEEDINSFEFVDDSKDKLHGRKLSQEEIILKEQELYDLKVDELDVKNYSDTLYWKKEVPISSSEVEKMMADLEL